MSEYALIIVSSVTYAKRIEQIAERKGITVTIGHTPKCLAQKGCSYAVKVKMRDKAAVLKIAEELMLKVFGVYRRKGEAYDLLG